MCWEPRGLCIKLSIFQIPCVDETRLCSLTGDSGARVYLCSKCWCAETKLAPTAGCALATLGPARQSLIKGETTCRVWRGMHQGLHWGWRTKQKAVCFDFKMHVKWGKEAKNLLTTVSDQQLLRYLYQGSWENYKCSLVLNQKFNYQNRCDFEDRLIKLPKTQVGYQFKRCLSWFQLARNL